MLYLLHMLVSMGFQKKLVDANAVWGYDSCLLG
jgi:hypothetical protein